MIIPKTLDPPLGFVIILIQTITFTANHRVYMMRFGQLIIFETRLNNFKKCVL